MPFLIFSNAKIQFSQKKLISRFYTTVKALSITKQVEIIDKKEFTIKILDENVENFVV